MPAGELCRVPSPQGGKQERFILVVASLSFQSTSLPTTFCLLYLLLLACNACKSYEEEGPNYLHVCLDNVEIPTHHIPFIPGTRNTKRTRVCQRGILIYDALMFADYIAQEYRKQQGKEEDTVQVGNGI